MGTSALGRRQWLPRNLIKAHFQYDLIKILMNVCSSVTLRQSLRCPLLFESEPRTETVFSAPGHFTEGPFFRGLPQFAQGLILPFVKRSRSSLRKEVASFARVVRHPPESRKVKPRRCVADRNQTSASPGRTADARCRMLIFAASANLVKWIASEARAIDPLFVAAPEQPNPRNKDCF